MGIITRFVRIFKADIHGVMDQLEDKALLLKQYLRDMEASLEEKETRLKKLNAARNQARRECDKYGLEIHKIEQDIESALKKEKDDIARLLIKKLKPLCKLRDSLEGHMDTLDQEVAGLQECIARQRLQYDQLRHRAREYFHTAEPNEWEKTRATVPPEGNSEEISQEEIELELLQRKEALSASIS